MIHKTHQNASKYIQVSRKKIRHKSCKITSNQNASQIAKIFISYPKWWRYRFRLCSLPQTPGLSTESVCKLGIYTNLEMGRGLLVNFQSTHCQKYCHVGRKKK